MPGVPRVGAAGVVRVALFVALATFLGGAVGSAAEGHVGELSLAQFKGRPGPSEEHGPLVALLAGAALGASCGWSLGTVGETMTGGWRRATLPELGASTSVRALGGGLCGAAGGALGGLIGDMIGKADRLALLTSLGRSLAVTDPASFGDAWGRSLGGAGLGALAGGLSGLAAGAVIGVLLGLAYKGMRG